MRSHWRLRQRCPQSDDRKTHSIPFPCAYGATVLLACPLARCSPRIGSAVRFCLFPLHHGARPGTWMPRKRKPERDAERQHDWDLDFSIVTMLGSLPYRLKVMGFSADDVEADAGNDFFRKLAVESDRAIGDPFFDARVDARNQAGRPEWACGAFILTSSHKMPFLKRLLDDVALPCDCRYLVLETKRLNEMQIAMAENTWLFKGPAKELMAVKAVVNKLRVLTLTDENRDSLVSFSSNLLTAGIVSVYMEGANGDTEVEGPPSAQMNDLQVKAMNWFIQDSSTLMQRLERRRFPGI